jgi:PEP-CTERM motif-containing protein
MIKSTLIRLLLSACLVIVFYGVGKADHLTLTGIVTGSFNGAPFTSITSFQGITFTGGTFTFFTPDEFARTGFVSNQVGVLSHTGVVQPTSPSDNLRLLLQFDSGGQLILQYELFANTATQAIAFNISPSVTPIVFTSSGHTVTGFLSIGFLNLTTFRQSSPGQGVINLGTIDPPHPTPEPVSLILFGTGLAATAIFARRKISKK